MKKNDNINNNEKKNLCGTIFGLLPKLFCGKEGFCIAILKLYCRIEVYCSLVTSVFVLQYNLLNSIAGEGEKA